MSSDHRPLYLALGLSALAFAIDVSIPGGYAIGALYLVTLAFFLRSRVTWHPLAHAAVATALTLADVSFGVHGPDVQLTLVNRGISVAAIWLFALVLSQHQRATLEREAAQRLFELTLAAAPDGMLVTAPDERIVYANAAAASLFGRDEQSLVGKRWPSLLSAPTDGNAAVRRALRPDGSERPVECKVSSMQPNGELRSIVVVRDVSERERFEERQRATQRMEAVGKLAGGIAHDFNNVLSAIIGNAEFAKHSLPTDSPAHEDLDELRASADRAAALTRQLLAFSRRQVIEPIRVDLNELSRQTERMLARLLGEDIEIQQVLAADLWSVEVDPSQLEQVLLNLAVNARDAMPKGGKLTIETQNVTLDDDYAREHPEVTAGDYVLLGVSDTGTGMSDEVRVRVFEPFFTTKPVGQGTGLGLATVYGIVKQAGGHIWVYSEPGRGTTFKIYLPRVDGGAQTLPGRRPSQRPVGGTERILVVEDEAPVRRLLVRTLNSAGYTVIEAANGADALLKLGSTDGQLDLLVTDVVMPQMGGRELATKVLAKHPDLPVLYLSGYTENAIVHHGVLDAGLVFLQKPFTPEELLRRVRDVLDAPTKG
ncbi:MAG: response regulator [Polyangiaceae bacterium]|nr:response regulator [Polyangiaceae bacterium]